MTLRLSGRTLRSKVARRIFMLFIACALVPVTTLAVISFVRVSRQLERQNRDRMVQASKAHGMAIYDRLCSVEASLVMVAALLETNSYVSDLAVNLSDRFDALALFEDGQPPRSLLGTTLAAPALSADQERFVANGGATVSTAARERTGEVLMTLGVDRSNGSSTRLVGRIVPEYLWAADGLATLTAYAAFDGSGRPLAAAHALREEFTRAVTNRVRQSSSGRFEWSDGSDTYLAGYWSLFLTPRFAADGWTVVLSEPLDYLEGPIKDFRKLVPLDRASLPVGGLAAEPDSDPTQPRAARGAPRGDPSDRGQGLRRARHGDDR